MYKVAICDDENLICVLIENIILNYSQINGLNIEVEVFLSGEELYDYILNEHEFDLIYLDIGLSNMNGIEVAKLIRNNMKDYKTEIVFVTGKDCYDRQLFEVQPLNFISKPIESRKVVEVLKLAIYRSNLNEGFFNYKKGAMLIKIPIRDIIYFESYNRKIIITTIKNEDIFYGTIDEIYSNLSRHQFLKIHRSYIINYIHVLAFTYNEVQMSNNAKLLISQSRRKKIREIQLKYSHNKYNL